MESLTEAITNFLTKIQFLGLNEGTFRKKLFLKNVLRTPYHFRTGPIFENSLLKILKISKIRKFQNFEN